LKTVSHNYCCICKAWAINETKSSKNAAITNTFIQRASCIAQELKLRSATSYSTTLTIVPLITHGKSATLKSGIYSIVMGKPTIKKFCSWCHDKCRGCLDANTLPFER